MINISKKIQNQFLKSWWLILFVVACYAFYERGLREYTNDFSKLQHQYLDLQKEKALASSQQENLTLQINSQSDPDWVELTLIKDLGVVAEGQTKVLFTDRQELLESAGD